MQRQRWLGALTLGGKAAHRLNPESGVRASGRVIVESGQTCDFKRADDFFGLLFASLERSHFVLRLIRKYKIPEMRELRARLAGRVTVAHQLVIARKPPTARERSARPHRCGRDDFHYHG